MGKYQIIYADPPWEYSFSGTRNQAKPDDYSTLNKQELCQIDIKSLAADNSILLMWVIFPHLDWAFDVMQAWGFRYITNAFTWIKENRTGYGLFWGMGHYTRSNAELCLLGKRGDGLPVVDHGVHSVITTPISKHSKKPPVIKNHIEAMFGAVTRVELLARKEPELFNSFEGWDVWGNEVESDIELEGTAFCNIQKGGRK